MQAPRQSPSVSAILGELRAAGTDKKHASAARVGIPMDKAYGVSVGIVRTMAKGLKGRHALAEPLWATGVHEARLLAIFVADPQTMRRTDIERWLRDVVSWICAIIFAATSSASAPMPQL
jgi:3-methyladenine DNA glycosylase AlkD